MSKQGLPYHLDEKDTDRSIETRTFTFNAGSPHDPRPAGNKLSNRFARCLPCNKIVHFSRILKRWAYDDGTFHTGHLVEFPVDWISDKTRNEIKIQLRQEDDNAWH